MIESDNEMEESIISNASSESDYSDDSEIVDFMDNSVVNLSANDWCMDFKKLSYMEFTVNSGRLSFHQYIPSKQSWNGIKIYKLCDSNSGYIWNCLVYTGKDTEVTESGALYWEHVETVG
ncbi:piggyBac transposable element-derived protein 4 [Nephila pilipes]|uniref:PiggyBac transposable element-derived protein 4 n=1 Tax=Nephila pilipes TaxID=299642 RepID=A0A8X6MYA6_NEPPI|nr:piggyBac transposable element-derived protein 4 [Nephila pilipes]